MLSFVRVRFFGSSARTRIREPDCRIELEFEQFRGAKPPLGVCSVRRVTWDSRECSLTRISLRQTALVQVRGKFRQRLEIRRIVLDHETRPSVLDDLLDPID